MSIYLSSVIGSRELEGSEIYKAITSLAIKLNKIRNTLKDRGGVSIDLTVILPGNTHKPDFEGMRMTSFSANDGVLHIESVVPEKMLHSQQAAPYMSALLQDVVENADDFFNEQGLEFASDQWQGIWEEGSMIS